MRTVKIPKNARIENENEILESALKAYYKRAEKSGGIALEPSISQSEVDGKFCYIRNGSDLLAKYDYRNKKFVEPTKKDLQDR